MSRSNYKFGGVWYSLPIPAGSKIKFRNERNKFSVMASNVAFAVCTQKLFWKTLYTVIDFHENVRGTENLVFWYGVETERECQEMLDRLTRWISDVSHRNFVALDIESISIPQRKIPKT